MLDLIGVFGWAANRELAISQAPSAVGWHRDWLARHGETLDVRVGRVEVVEEVAATLVDGYERNAIFAADRAPVALGELEAAMRHLDFARRDLLDLGARIEAFEAAGGRLDPGDDREADAVTGTDAARPAIDVLRHLAGSEAWFVSRLDPAARFSGSEASDTEAYLSGTRAWLVDALRRLHAADPALARTDGKGEAWTLRKLLRRAVYHSIDHLRELDRRLARSEGRVDRLVFRYDRLSDVAPLGRLLRSVGWDRRTEDMARLERAIAGSVRMIGAWDGDELVGFVREIGDGEFNAHVSMVVVDPRWQDLGLATRLIERMLSGRDDVRFTLGAADGLEGYYARFGFEPDRRAMVRRRRI
jgi:ribosomal protein S18 acetylase RimI-like enzyme